MVGEASTTPISLPQAQLEGVGIFAEVSSHTREKASGILRKESEKMVSEDGCSQVTPMEESLWAVGGTALLP